MTPIERAARAMADNLESHELNWEGYVHCVRATLSAIHEPSEAMVKAGWDSECIIPSQSPEGAWTAMIDAMLEEG